MQVESAVAIFSAYVSVW